MHDLRVQFDTVATEFTHRWNEGRPIEKVVRHRSIRVHDVYAYSRKVAAERAEAYSELATAY